ncbi:ArsR/SmtB family transcription factor [Streptosporangium sp. NPDC002721]|uniref:ArsR/SmtB family transcription factor n=1 Tax=Streptosporangium sp. NPDC002721 TaxID=3366188 RepID=UPI003696154E
MARSREQPSEPAARGTAAFVTVTVTVAVLMTVFMTVAVFVFVSVGGFGFVRRVVRGLLVLTAGGTGAGGFVGGRRTGVLLVGHGYLVCYRCPFPGVYVAMYARDNASGTNSSQEQPTGAQVEAAIEAFRMLSDATRLRLMWLLSSGEYDVGSLAEAIGVARPSVSQHLAKLRLAGLVRTRRDGRRVLYRARDAHVRALIGEALFHADHEVSGIPRHD